MTSPTPSTPKIEPSLDKNFFIWGNIVLMAGTPWLLTLSMAGLAVGDSIFPDWFEISLLGLPAIALVTWLQWIQPISPFSLWFIAKPVESLSEPERRALTLISQQRNGWYVTGWIAIAVAIFMSAVFCKIYAASALSQVIAPFPDELRFFGVLWAEVFFLLSNFLLQSGISALRVKLTADSELVSLTPFAPEKIKDSFTHIGWRSPQFLTGDQTGDQVDSTLDAISPETLTEVVTAPVEEKELEISDLVENEAIDQLLEQEELEVSHVAENFAESEVVQELFDDSAIAETTDIVSEILPELAIENAAEQPAIENILQNQVEEVSEELEINDEDLTIEEVFSEIRVDESLEIADNLTESVTEGIEPEEIEPELLSEEIVADEIESDLVSEETVVDEIESELVSEEIDSEEIESEQLFSAEETQITDSNNTDALADLEISDSTPDEEIEEDLETVQELEIVEEVIEELDISDYKQEIAEEIDEVTEDIAIAEISLQGTEVVDSTSSDFEDELDELIAFNLYVENILQDYLEESLDDATDNPDDTNNDGVVDISELTATSETATAIAEDVLIAEEILEEGIPETITPPPTLEIPKVEEPTNNPDDTNNDGVVDITELTATSETATAIAEEVLIAEEILEEGIPETVADQSTLEIPDQEIDKNVSVVESQEESKIPQEPKQSPKYLVEEFLVDKYLAKLEQLNNADKNESAKESPQKTNTNVIQPVEPKLDEFAGLDELIDGKTINKKPVTEE